MESARIVKTNSSYKSNYSEDLRLYSKVQRNAVKALLTTRTVHIQKWNLWFSLYKKFLYALLMKNVQNGVLETKT